MATITEYLDDFFMGPLFAIFVLQLFNILFSVFHLFIMHSEPESLWFQTKKALGFNVLSKDDEMINDLIKSGVLLVVLMVVGFYGAVSIFKSVFKFIMGSITLLFMMSIIIILSTLIIPDEYYK